MSFSRTLLFLTLVFSTAAQNTCPGGQAPSKNITATNGLRFAVCLNTDFKATDISSAGNVQTVEQLVEGCSLLVNCTAATRVRNYVSGYYKSAKNVVGNADTGCDSIYKVPQLLNICAGSTAPSRFVTTTNGVRFGVCPNTDFKDGDIVTSGVGGITSVEKLADDCSKRAGCLGASRGKSTNTGWPKKLLNAATSDAGVEAVFKILDSSSSATSSTVSSRTSSASVVSSSSTRVTTTTSSAVSSRSSSSSSSARSSSSISSSSSSRPPSISSTLSTPSSSSSSSIRPSSTSSAASISTSLISSVSSTSSRPSTSATPSTSSTSSRSSFSSSSASATSSAAPMPTVCAGGSSAPRIITTNDKSQFAVCPGTDFQGGDIANGVGGINTMEQLAEDCAARASCIGSTLTKYYGAWPKSTLSDPSSNADTDSVVKIFNNTLSNPTDSSILGVWSQTIRFPVIPVSVFMVAEKPRGTRLVAFSAYTEMTFGTGANSSYTQFADYNLGTGKVSQLTVRNTEHEMFCPGISMLQDGKIVVTGGADAAKVSIFDPASNSWAAGAQMQMPRGYQSSVTLSSGKVYTMGGSWSGGVATKDGEIYDPATGTWTKLSGALVTPAITQDKEIDKKDNHHWFFAWSDNSILQAGPSMAMNWYTTSGSGSVQSAGQRDTTDAMCGIFAMYDATRGKIITAGGAPNYHNDQPTTHANHITITTAGVPPVVERVADMAYPRQFANAVILPNGQVLVSGGQSFAKAFTDDNSVLVPELWDPTTKTFTPMRTMRTPRNYHSTAILLPDGRVFTGGGGLCLDYADTCPGVRSNHPDGEIWSPPYLFNTDGSDATRPTFTGMSSDTAANGYTVRAGGTLTVTVGQAAQGLSFAMLRMGTNTHSVNTDQRRVPLEKIQQSGNQYTLTLPSDYGILIPGEWYVFVISAQGTPSISRSVTVVL